MSKTLELLRKIAIRTSVHPDDTDADHKRDLYHANSLANQAAKSYEPVTELLADLLEYFEGKQDAETFPDGRTIANEEMKFHMRISAILEGKVNA